jgi:hypothetical protein
MSATEERIEVERPIAATPAEVFAVLSDPQGHVAIDSSGMLMSAEGDRVTAVDDTFVVHMDREALPVISEAALRASLGILARTVAPGRPRPGA